MHSAVPRIVSRTTEAHLSSRRWTILALLVVSICINYVDRGSISIASKGISEELGSNAKELGELFSAFFWTPAGLQIVAKGAIDRYNGYRLCTICLRGVVSCHRGHGSRIGILRNIRGPAALGVSESVAYPAYSKFIAAIFPEEQRGANAFIYAGSKLGPAPGMLIGGRIAPHFGWRAMFFIIGGISLVWLWPWRVVAPQSVCRIVWTLGTAAPR